MHVPTELLDYATPRQREVLEALNAAGGNGNKAASALGCHRSLPSATLKAVRERADKMGFRDELNGRVAEGFALKGYSQFTKTAAGEPIWLKARKAEQDYWEGIRAAIDNIQAPPRDIAPTPRAPQSDIIPWLQIGDAHIGMLAHEAETGANFDIGIAKREICAAAATLIDEGPQCERMVLNDLGDGTHYETFKGETMGHGHALDYDTRYWKMIDAYVEISQFLIEQALTKAKTVDCIYNQGNHSESNDIWIAAAMRAVYRNNPRVNILPNRGRFIGYRMGETMAVIHHGDKCKPGKFREVASTDFSIDWGETKFRYLDGGHVHHNQREELAGCIFESWNNLAPGDKYANDGGWRSKQSMSLVLRSRRYGDVGRQVMPIERVRDLILAKHPDHYVPPELRAFAA